MHARHLITALATVAFAAGAMAQSTIWTPAAYAATPGNSNNVFPWGWTSSASHYEQIYGATNFTSQSVNVPVLITRLRWRAWPTTSSWSGGSFANVVLNLSTAALPYTSASANFAANHGPDLTNVYTGPVTVIGGTGNGTGVPGPYLIDVMLSTPFLYDPTTGDLCMEMQVSAGFSGVAQPVDAASGVPLTRIYELTSATSAAGTVGTSYGLITEFTYQPASGYATQSTYGTGCYRRSSSFYESFASAPAFDLANSSLSMIYTGTGYTVLPGISSFVPPSGAATTVANGDDVEQVVTLGSTFNFPGGSTTQLDICSNGFVSAASGNGVSFSPSSGAFLAFTQACWSPGWHDFNPTAAGSGPIKFEEVGSVSYVTWNSVWDYAGTSSANASTMQIQFDRSSGNVHMIWQTMSTLGVGFVTGYKPAGTVVDPGNRDISVTLPGTFTLSADQQPLALAASARPVIGTSINLVTSNIPGGTPLGANILSFTQYNPGLDLTGIGMPGCHQYVGLDSSNVFLVSGPTATVALAIPNNPGLAGLQVFSQSATFSAGFNPLGVLASNGVALGLDVN